MSDNEKVLDKVANANSEEARYFFIAAGLDALTQKVQHVLDLNKERDDHHEDIIKELRKDVVELKDLFKKHWDKEDEAKEALETRLDGIDARLTTQGRKMLIAIIGALILVIVAVSPAAAWIVTTITGIFK